MRRDPSTPLGMTNLAEPNLSLHQQHRSAALDLARDFAVHVCWHAGHAARKNLAAFADEFFQEIRIFVIDCFERNIDPTPWHWSISAAERGTALWRFWLHWWLLGFAVQRVSPQKRIVFLFLQAVRRARTFFISRGHVTRGGFAQSFRLGAFKSDNFLRHSCYSLTSVGAASSSSVSPPSSSVNPNNEVTE